MISLIARNTFAAQAKEITVSPGKKNIPVTFTPDDPSKIPVWRLNVKAKTGYKHKGPFKPQNHYWKLIPISKTEIEFSNKSQAPLTSKR